MQELSNASARHTQFTQPTHELRSQGCLADCNIQATCSRERATNGVKIRLRQRREAVRDGGASLQQSSRGCKHSQKVRKAAESEAYLGQVVTGSLLHVQNEVARNRPDRMHGATQTQQNARRKRNKLKSVTRRLHPRRSSRQPATHAQGEERNRSTGAEQARQGTAPPVELDPTRKDAAVGAFACRALRKDASEALCKAACNDNTAQQEAQQDARVTDTSTHVPAVASEFHRRSGQSHAHQWRRPCHLKRTCNDMRGATQGTGADAHRNAATQRSRAPRTENALADHF